LKEMEQERACGVKRKHNDCKFIPAIGSL